MNAFNACAMTSYAFANSSFYGLFILLKKKKRIALFTSYSPLFTFSRSLFQSSITWTNYFCSWVCFFYFEYSRGKTCTPIESAKRQLSRHKAVEMYFFALFFSISKKRKTRNGVNERELPKMAKNELMMMMMMTKNNV